MEQNTDLSLSVHPSDNSQTLQMLRNIDLFCTKKNCFRDASLDENLKKYYENTNQLLQKEIKNHGENKDNVFTIVANMLLMLNNSNTYFTI